MYCPYCAYKLEDADNYELRCSNTGALFSQHITKIFNDLVVGKVTNPLPKYDLGSLFCFKCGTKMEKGTCNICNIPITLAILRELIELNPHNKY